MSSLLAPQDALRALADRLRDEQSVISGLVVEDPGRDSQAALAALAAAGPRAANDPAGYAFVVEAVREGYLLHYAEPRLLRGADPDLSLLAGDYLYALGLQRLAAIGDIDATAELADLISISAYLHAGDAPDPELVSWLWLGATVAITAGGNDEIAAAKAAVRTRSAAAAGLLRDAARTTAASSGIDGPLGEAAASIQSPR